MLLLVLLLINTLLISAKDVHTSESSNIHYIFSNFNKFETIRDYLKFLKMNYRNKVALEQEGFSHGNRTIMCIKISFKSYENEPSQRPIILIDGAHHAREWMSPAVALYLIHQLVENEENEYMLFNVDWYIIPVLNPDGYIYTQSTKKRRSWRKNRANGIKCDGVDLNRNYDYHWGEDRKDGNECADTYRGPKPFSEPETSAIKNLVLKYQERIQLYVSLHTYGELLIYPWGYENKPVSKEFEHEHKMLGDIVADAINSVRGSHYKAGRHSEILYAASGVSIDWMVGVAKIPLCFILEINDKSVQFYPPEEDIIPTGTEIFQGFKVFHSYIENKTMTDRNMSIIEQQEQMPGVYGADDEEIIMRMAANRRRKMRSKMRRKMRRNIHRKLHK